MRITTRGRYAVRAAIVLAQQSKDGAPVSITRIAEQEGISSVFLEQIFFKLRKAGIVNSVRGPGGGFYFALPLETITVKNILDAAGETLIIAPCKAPLKPCVRYNNCVTHPIWEDLTDMIINYLSGLNLAAILEKCKTTEL